MSGDDEIVVWFNSNQLFGWISMCTRISHKLPSTANKMNNRKKIYIGLQFITGMWMERTGKMMSSRGRVALKMFPFFFRYSIRTRHGNYLIEKWLIVFNIHLIQKLKVFCLRLPPRILSTRRVIFSSVDACCECEWCLFITFRFFVSFAPPSPLENANTTWNARVHSSLTYLTRAPSLGHGIGKHEKCIHHLVHTHTHWRSSYANKSNNRMES